MFVIVFCFIEGGVISRKQWLIKERKYLISISLLLVPDIGIESVRYGVKSAVWGTTLENENEGMLQISGNGRSS